jgi:hypothetical protein
VNVTRLGAFADFEDDEALQRQVLIGIEQFAMLDDGRRLILDRAGFGTTIAGLAASEDPWSHMTVEDIEDDVRTTLAPDVDDGNPSHDHDWRHLARRLQEHGVECSADALMRVPYDIVLSDRLKARLGPSL